MAIEIERGSELPPAVARKIIRWVLGELDLERIQIAIRVWRTSHWHHRGHFFHDEYDDDTHEFSLSLGVPWEYPYVHQATSRFTKRRLRGGPPPIDPRNWVEALICITAHEATHVRQTLRKASRPGYWQTRGAKRVYVSARRFSEVEAEWAEHDLLKRYREETQ